MEREKFDALVAELERAAKANPAGYKARVFGLALLGYGYVFFVLAAVIGLIGGLVMLATIGKGAAFLIVKKLGIPLMILALVILRAMWIRLSAPEGIELRRKDYPALFDTLDKMRRRLKGPRIHTVLLDDNFNAAISQVSRLGIFGWQKNYLILGLPLMQALSPEHLLAVIAHEYGHLSGAHGKFSAWIYRVRQTWYKLMEAFDQEQRWGKFIFSRFFDWYAPYFWAYSFALARANEYEADHCAAELTSPRRAADALTSVYVKGDFLREEFWPRLYRRADKEPQPAASLYVDTGVLLRGALSEQDADRWLEQAMAVETGSTDTHPSLKDRLAALGQEPRLPERVQPSAAEFFLRDRLASLAEHFSNVWRNGIHARWEERYQLVQRSLVRLEELEAKQWLGELSAEEAYEYAEKAEEFRPDADHLALYRAVIERDPNHVSAHYALGRLLLDRGDDTGIGHIEKAMERDAGAITPGCKLVYGYLVARNREQEAAPYEQRFYAQIEREQRVEAERDSLRLDDTYVPHAAPADAVAALITQLRKYKRIGRAYLVRKKTELSDAPLYVLGIIWRGFWPHDSDDDAKLTRTLADEIKFPGEMFFIVLANNNRKFRKVITKVNGALIYRR